MTKTELIQVLKNYPAIRPAIGAQTDSVVIKRYRNELCFAVPSWAAGVERGINELLKSENEIARLIIELSYLKGDSDREIIMRLPVSDSGYYRIKKHIEEKIYELCIFYGYVTEEDILQNDIG